MRTFDSKALRLYIGELRDGMGGAAQFARASGVSEHDLSKAISGVQGASTKLLAFLGVTFDKTRGVYVQETAQSARVVDDLNTGLAAENTRLMLELRTARTLIGRQKRTIEALEQALAAIDRKEAA